MAEIPTPTTGYSAPAGDRPLGVTILAILEILGGLLNLLVAVGLFALGALDPFFGIIWLMVGAIMAILALLALVIGWGLWALKSWAWMLALILNIINLILNIFSQGWFGAIINLIIIIYLQQPDIKSRFR
ncbi:MAG: hypothetical protein ACFFFO_12870 [Candidatus Thorarchaeota archaeon]